MKNVTTDEARDYAKWAMQWAAKWGQPSHWSMAGPGKVHEASVQRASKIIEEATEQAYGFQNPDGASLIDQDFLADCETELERMRDEDYPIERRP